MDRGINRYDNKLANMPIGGCKQSGFGREFSHEVLNHDMQRKSVIVNFEERPIGTFDH